jgi:Tol biopolymer transport system component
MNANGTGAQRLTDNDAVADDGPKFSPDGSKIVFSSRREDITQDIFVMNADGSGEVQITDVDANDLYPDW